MATRSLPYVTVEQYLEYDSDPEARNEYLSGEIIPMEAGTPWHSLIANNVAYELTGKLQRTPCRVFSSSLRVSLNPRSSYVYPDVTVVCGQLEYADAKKETVSNPKLVVEVLSPSTIDRDLGQKARWYWKVPSLMDLIFIEQNRIGVEFWHRGNDGEWKRTIIEDASGTVKIESLNIEIPVTNFYTGVELAAVED